MIKFFLILKVIWCQNVRMKHLHDLLSSMDHGDYLLSIDADFKQNKPFNLDALEKEKPNASFWCQRKKGKIRETVASTSIWSTPSVTYQGMLVKPIFYLFNKGPVRRPLGVP